MTTLNDIRNVYRGRQPQPIGRHRFFSVLVPVVEKDGQPHLLFEVRARAMESQPGEICFPGGNVEQGRIRRTALCARPWRRSASRRNRWS